MRRSCRIDDGDASLLAWFVGRSRPDENSVFVLLEATRAVVMGMDMACGSADQPRLCELSESRRMAGLQSDL